jgi:hypothetical protein
VSSSLPPSNRVNLLPAPRGREGRVVVFVEPASPIDVTLAAARRVVPSPAHLHLVMLADEALSPRQVE